MSKQDSLVKGTLILALAAFIARFLGIAQTVPLVHILGDDGMALYRLANNLYLTLLPLATAGIPSALSKLIAEKTALGQQREAEQLFQVSIRFAIVAGFVITIPLMVIAPFYAAWAKLSEGAYAIWAIAPALLLFPLIAMLRGYFQGRQMMMAGGLSQIWEQILRVLTGVGFAVALGAVGLGLDWKTAGASFGGVFGAVAALVVMLYYLRKLRSKDAENRISLAKEPKSQPTAHTRGVIVSLLKLSIPISLFSSTVSLINLIDNSIGVPLLMDHMNIAEARNVVGALVGKAQSLAGIAVVFAVAVSQSLVPIISSAFSRGDMDEVRRKSRQALIMALLSGMPVVAVLTAGAGPINMLLFGKSTGTDSIAFLSAVTIFQIMMMTSGAILMGMGRMKMLMWNLVVCVSLKLFLSFLFAKSFGISGMIIATGLCYLASTVMNLLYLRREIGFEFLGRKWVGIVFTVAALLVAGCGVEWLNRSVIHLFSGSLFAQKVNDFVQTAIVGIVMLAVYGVMLFTTRVVTAQELSRLPGPLRKIVNRLAKGKTMPS